MHWITFIVNSLLIGAYVLILEMPVEHGLFLMALNFMFMPFYEYIEDKRKKK